MTGGMKLPTQPIESRHGHVMNSWMNLGVVLNPQMDNSCKRVHHGSYPYHGGLNLFYGSSCNTR